MVTTQRPRAQAVRPLGGAMPALGLTLALFAGLGTSPVAAQTLDREQTTTSAAATHNLLAARAAVPSSVSQPVQAATTALAHSVTNLRKHHPAKGIASLHVVSVKVGQAHRAGVAQIGAPPTNPESDDVPGPPSVLAVLKLEHRVGTDVVNLFNGRKGPKVVKALRHTLTVAQRRRVTMLNQVIALPPEGAGADYANGMADTVGIYKKEVQQITAALDKFKLSASGKLGLTHALARAKATKAKVDAAFGGGE